MRIWRRCGASAILAGLLFVMVVGPAFAGGWAVVTLDAVPQGPAAEQVLALGFMVRQHGVTPIDAAPAMLTARNTTTGETVRATARKEGPIGHFVVDVAFPSAGEWKWEIKPDWFGATDLGTLTVLAPGAAKSQPAVAGGATSQTTTAGAAFPASAFATARNGLHWLGIALLVVALSVGLWGQRAAALRRDPAAH